MNGKKAKESSDEEDSSDDDSAKVKKPVQCNGQAKGTVSSEQQEEVDSGDEEEENVPARKVNSLKHFPELLFLKPECCT